MLNVLLNNAGISGGMSQPTLSTSAEVIKEVFKTNVFSVVALTQAFINLLRQSAEPRIVSVTTGLVSLTLQSDLSWRYYGITGAAYQPCKAALNAYTIMLAQELRDMPFMVKAALLGPDGPTGQFFSNDNAPKTSISPW